MVNGGPYSMLFVVCYIALALINIKNFQEKVLKQPFCMLIYSCCDTIILSICRLLQK
jgi:hypothetical protein